MIQNRYVMTEFAQRISETPMAPYTDLLRSMQPQEMRIVVTFLQEAIAESEKQNPTPAEIIRRKFKNLTISPETKELIEGLSLSRDEMDDERTRHILGYK